MDPASEIESSVASLDVSEFSVMALRNPTEGPEWAEAADWGIIMTDDEAIEDSDESEVAASATLMLQRQKL